MKTPRQVTLDWLGLQRAFERFDPSWDGEPLPYLNIRTGQISYFGAEEGVDLADTLDFDRHVAVTLPEPCLADRHARMRAFAAAAEADLCARLRHALAQHRPVARFYEVLEAHPAAYARWQRGELPRVRDLIREWLRAEALQVRDEPPWD
jgi:hypothetical protein